MISNGEYVWRQKNGKRAFVNEMASEHILNAIRQQETAWFEKFPGKLIVPNPGERPIVARLREVGGWHPDVVPLYHEADKRGLTLLDSPITLLEPFVVQDVWTAAPLVSVKLGRDVNRCGYCASSRISVMVSSDTERVHCNDCSLEIVGAKGIEVWNSLRFTRAEEIFSCS